MKFFLKYLRYKTKYILLYLLFFLIFAVCFFLFDLPFGAVIYPFVICTAVGTAVFFFSFQKAKERYALLKNINDSLFETLPKAFDTDSEEYRNIIFSLRDIYEKTQTDDFEKYKNMTEYFTVWAHQIKTPISSMKLRLQNEDSSLSRQLLNELNRIETYVEMVLTYLKLDSDSTDYVFKRCDLDKIIRQCVKRFSGEFIERKLKLDFSETGIFVLSDEKWLSFVIEQVLSNALKYTKEGSISIYKEKENLLIIKDTGIGIKKEDLPRIFDNGFTGFNGRTEKKASGIGLYISKRICTNLGHFISAESEVGVGTKIYIDFVENKIEIE